VCAQDDHGEKSTRIEFFGYLAINCVCIFL
jgi:hypothetical protein